MTASGGRAPEADGPLAIGVPPAETGVEARVVVTLGGFHLDVALAAAAGETIAVVGPNGAGKTTVLRALAGLRPVDSGFVRIAGVTVDDPDTGILVPPERRDVGVVFQQYLLFPHLSALENVAFGLRARGTGRVEARRRAGEWLDRLGIGPVAELTPPRLSGGQAQRVALARALAPEPALLLLDEPLAALDAGARIAMRRELRRHLGGYGGAVVMITHDPLDAAVLARRVVVVEDGRVVQAGTPEEIAARPCSRYVADLVGTNLIAGTAAGHDVTTGGGAVVRVAEPASGDVLVVIPPRAVALHVEAPGGSPRNAWPVTVAGAEPLGDRLRVELEGPLRLVAEITPAAYAELGLAEGRAVWAAVKATEVVAYPA